MYAGLDPAIAVNVSKSLSGMSKVDPKLSVISLAVARSSAETLSLAQIAVVLFRIWALRFGMIRINGRFGSVSLPRRSSVTPAAIERMG